MEKNGRIVKLDHSKDPLNEQVSQNIGGRVLQTLKFSRPITSQIDIDINLDPTNKSIIEQKISDIKSFIKQIISNSFENKFLFYDDLKKLEDNGLNRQEGIKFMKNLLTQLYQSNSFTQKDILIPLINQTNSVITNFYSQKLFEYFYKLFINIYGIQDNIETYNNINKKMAAKLKGKDPIWFENKENIKKILIKYHKKFKEKYKVTDEKKQKYFDAYLKSILNQSIELLTSIVDNNFKNFLNISSHTIDIIKSILLFNQAKYRTEKNLDEFIIESLKYGLENLKQSINQNITNKELPFEQLFDFFSENEPQLSNNINFDNSLHYCELNQSPGKIIKIYVNEKYIIIMSTDSNNKILCQILSQKDHKEIGRVNPNLTFKSNDKLNLNIFSYENSDFTKSEYLCIRKGQNYRIFDLKKIFEDQEEPISFYKDYNNENHSLNIDQRYGLTIHTSVENKNDIPISCILLERFNYKHSKRYIPILFKEIAYQAEFTKDGTKIIVVFKNGNIQTIDLNKHFKLINGQYNEHIKGITNVITNKSLSFTSEMPINKLCDDTLLHCSNVKKFGLEPALPINISTSRKFSTIKTANNRLIVVDTQQENQLLTEKNIKSTTGTKADDYIIGVCKPLGESNYIGIGLDKGRFLIFDTKHINILKLKKIILSFSKFTISELINDITNYKNCLDLLDKIIIDNKVDSFKQLVNTLKTIRQEEGFQNHKEITEIVELINKFELKDFESINNFLFLNKQIELLIMHNTFNKINNSVNLDLITDSKNAEKIELIKKIYNNYRSHLKNIMILTKKLEIQEINHLGEISRTNEIKNITNPNEIVNYIKSLETDEKKELSNISKKLGISTVQELISVVMLLKNYDYKEIYTLIDICKTFDYEQIILIGEFINSNDNNITKSIDLLNKFGIKGLYPIFELDTGIGQINDFCIDNNNGLYLGDDNGKTIFIEFGEK